jgi:threonine/homoserine/homoserine lactone efflux protein
VTEAPFNPVSTYWGIFSFSFLTALTGAMAPGPLMTYTLMKSIGGKRRGYLMGAWIIAGHAILEIGIIFFLLLGFSFLFKNMLIVRTIGVLGGGILCYFGISIIRDVFAGKISTSFAEVENCGGNRDDSCSKGTLENPLAGGILVSMSNPYWWVWWATIGLAFMIQFDVSFRNPAKLLAFFLGHEAGDLAWYLAISFLAFFGLRHLNQKAYYGILMICGIFMFFFGIYLGFSPFFKADV